MENLLYEEIKHDPSVQKRRFPDVSHYFKLLENLSNERSGLEDTWRDCSDMFLGYRGRFLQPDAQESIYARNTKLKNNSTVRAARILAAGMMAGVTSPARKWFKITIQDENLKARSDVKQYLDRVETKIYSVFNRSNVYNSLHELYTELGVFGTATMGIFEDFNEVIWTKTFTAGAYYLDADMRSDVNTFVREYSPRVSEVVREFGFENCTQSTQTLWKTGSLNTKVDVIHVVEPNDDADSTSPLARDMKFRSVYFERTACGQEYLRKSGYREFPFAVGRWTLASEDIYSAKCPGIDALQDGKALQLGERRMYQLLDREANGPLQGPATLRGYFGDSAPVNGKIYWTKGEDNNSLRPIYAAQPNYDRVIKVNDRVEQRIDATFYVDLFLMLANSDRRQQTATEVAEKHQEKMLMLGPVMERLNKGVLNVLIERTFNILNEAGVLPIPPDVLQDRTLRIEYVSVMAQAQRMVAVNSIQQVAEFAAGMSQNPNWQDAARKVDAARAVDDFADAVGAPPEIIKGNDEVQAQKQAEQQQQAAQAQMARAQQAVEIGKQASEIRTDEDSIVGRAIDSASGA